VLHVHEYQANIATTAGAAPAARILAGRSVVARSFADPLLSVGVLLKPTKRASAVILPVSRRPPPARFTALDRWDAARNKEPDKATRMPTGGNAGFPTGI
jgi:hypothetical protein